MPRPPRPSAGREGARLPNLTSPESDTRMPTARRSSGRMRLAVRIFAVAAFVPALLLGSAAFSHTATGARSISVDVVGDAAAYLAVAANTASTHQCFVAQDPTTGKVALSFGAVTSACHADGTGTGIAAGGAGGKHTRYAFHDILIVTNKGTKGVNAWVNGSAGASGSLVDVARSTTAWSLTDASYFTTSATPVLLAPGASMYVGVRVDTGELSSGTVSGTLTLTALRSSGA